LNLTKLWEFNHIALLLPWELSETAAGSLINVTGELGLSTPPFDRQSEPPSPTNYSDFVHEQNDYGHQRDPDGQRVASEEVQGHPCPAEACRY
jgi:hypothetical protein